MGREEGGGRWEVGVAIRARTLGGQKKKRSETWLGKRQRNKKHTNTHTHYGREAPES